MWQICKRFFALMFVVAVMTGCGSEKPENVSVTEEKTTLSVGMLKGPTGIGAVKLMEENEAGVTGNAYDFQIAATPDELMGKIINGELPIAALPTNVAAAVYNKTEGEIQVAAVNTLGVLHILENGTSIQSLADLQGKTIYATGQGATPEYVLNELLAKNNVSDVSIQYMAEHAELAAALAAGEVSIGMLPEPNVTSVILKNPETRLVIDLTEEWSKVEDSQLAMGCIVVRKDFLEENKEAFDLFLEEYEKSVNEVKDNPKEAAALVEKFGILPSAEVAEKAIPYCNIVCLEGAELKTALEGFYEVLFAANPKAVGGKLPDEDFYYQS